MRLLLSLPLFLLGSLAIVPPASAQEKDEDECLKLHPDITSPVEMVRCTADIDGSESRLENAYAALARLASPEELPPLKRAQRAWLVFRDAQCKYDAGGTGTGRSSDIIACKADMNRARVEELAGRSKTVVGPVMVSDVTEPSLITQRESEFGKDLLKSGIQGRVQSCGTMVDVTSGMSSGNHSFGAICKVDFGGEVRDLLLCNDRMVGHFALAASFVYDREWVTRFVQNNCTGG